MRRTIHPIFLTVFAFFSLLTPSLRAGTAPGANHKKNGLGHVSATVTDIRAIRLEQEASCLYNQIDLKAVGLAKKAFTYAYKGYVYLLQHHLLNESHILSICDFSQSSRNKRLYVIDLDQAKVLVNTYVAHGRKSGAEFANSFSNSQRSHKSSLGFYITEDTYLGDNGLSLKIHGLEKGFNDRADHRNIVIHGSRYVGDDFIQENQFNGRSFGCPAIPYEQAEEVIETIKNGSCLFIYHPTKKYIAKSKILNS